MNLSAIALASDFKLPHSGYHWNLIDANYFEGWYYRLTLPEIEQTFAFMYSIQDPIGDRSNSGGAIQILGIDETYLCRTINNTDDFFAARNHLHFGHWSKSNLQIKPQLLSLEQFRENIIEGYQATAFLNQGRIYDPVRNEFCDWEYEIEPIYSWGDREGFPKATAGWLSYLPIFEPGWQITTALGLATGSIQWQGKNYQFDRAPVYSEKNWGGSFPQKWFWINCNSFDRASELSLTAGGGIRQVLWWQEEVALIGIHYRGKFYEFAPWNSEISWCIEPWEKWQIEAVSKQYKVSIVGTTKSLGTYVRTPTAKGLVFNCRDTTQGRLSLELSSLDGKIIVSDRSNLAGLEVGGEPWNEVWRSP